MTQGKRAPDSRCLTQKGVAHRKTRNRRLSVCRRARGGAWNRLHMYNDSSLTFHAPPRISDAFPTKWATIIQTALNLPKIAKTNRLTRFLAKMRAKNDVYILFCFCLCFCLCVTFRNIWGVSQFIFAIFAFFFEKIFFPFFCVFFGFFCCFCYVAVTKRNMKKLATSFFFANATESAIFAEKIRFFEKNSTRSKNRKMNRLTFLKKLLQIALRFVTQNFNIRGAF